MKKLFLATAILALLGSAPAFAQSTSDANSGAVSGSASTANNGGNSNTNGPLSNTSTNSVTGASSDSTANAATTSTSSSVSRGGNATGGSATSTGGSSQASNGAAAASNNQGVTINTTTPKEQTVRTVPQVYAPALTTTLTETCMGSTSLGGSGVGVGVTIGTTWHDKDCVRRLNAREMSQTLGDRDAARALLCEDEDIRKAYESVGIDCHQRTIAEAPPPPPPLTPAPMAMPPPVNTPAPPLQSKGTMQPIPNGERD